MMKISVTLRYAIKTAMAVMLLTAVIFITLHSHAQTLGLLDWIIVPGSFLAWILILGNTMPEPMIKNLIILLVCLVVNGVLGFLVGALVGCLKTKCT